MTNFTLLAVPLFIYMGVMLEKSGLAEELLETMALLFAKVRGGLAVSVIIVGARMGASTGIVGATVVTMGSVCSNYAQKKVQFFSRYRDGSSFGTLGRIIPQVSF